MKKQWIKNADFNYSFLIDNKEVGKMEIQFSTMASKAVCTIDGVVFEIKRTGFWKSTIEIADINETIVVKTYPEKWYANTFIIEFENKKYKLAIRNNPLAEYVIKENDKDILEYGLDTQNHQLKVRISTSGNPNPIFDFLLWYLFVPIANENFGDTYSFLLSPSL